MSIVSNRLISVIIPCYNQGHFLGEAIESVLLQTHAHFEIIVVDDGSRDSTAEVSTRHPDVKYVRQGNQGQSAARNVGARASKGDYLVFLDADDRLLPNAFEVGLRCLDDHPESVFASGFVRLIATDGSSLPDPEQSCIESDHYRAFLQHCYIWTPTAVIFKKRVFESGFGYDLSVRGVADWDLYLRISKKFPVCCHDTVIAEYRVHTESMSHNAARMLRESLAVLRSQWGNVRGNKRYEEAIRVGVRGIQEYYGKPLVDDIRRHLKANEWKHAIRGMSILMWYYPRGFVKHLCPTVWHGFFTPRKMRTPASG
jgi:glycosyltransferase involved in cell wall biosynthesis